MTDVRNLQRVSPFGSQKFIVASQCNKFQCEVCQFEKCKWQPMGGKTSVPNPNSDGALKWYHLCPGAAVSVDHFESRLQGRTYTSFGKATSGQYMGGYIFINHASGYLHVEHQLRFSASESIRDKQNYEQFALGHEVIVTNYLADNGAFKANNFVAHLWGHNQKVQYCGVNAHHQNGVAERSILTVVSNMARDMLLHASMRWKQDIDSSLWPMAVNHATHVYNSLLQPICLLVHRSLDTSFVIYMFGAVLSLSSIQSYNKARNFLVGNLDLIVESLLDSVWVTQANDVPLVLNLQTGSISLQFYLVLFNDSLSTVPSIAKEDDLPNFWAELCLEGTHRIPLEKDVSVHLPDAWLTPPELDAKHWDINRQEHVHRSYQAPKPKTGGKNATELRQLTCEWSLRSVFLLQSGWRESSERSSPSTSRFIYHPIELQTQKGSKKKVSSSTKSGLSGMWY